MKLADEIRAKYTKPHYTFDDVTNEIRRHVFATYEEVAKYKFSSWPGFNVIYSDRVPRMKWSYGTEESCSHDLLLPEGSTDFDWRKIGKWFEEQGFEYISNANNRCKGWRIRF